MANPAPRTTVLQLMQETAAPKTASAERVYALAFEAAREARRLRGDAGYRFHVMRLNGTYPMVIRTDQKNRRTGLAVAFDDGSFCGAPYGKGSDQLRLDVLSWFLPTDPLSKSQWMFFWRFAMCEIALIR
jgi:hypothetical protein